MSLADRAVRVLPQVLVGGALVAVARVAAQPLADPDLWWHLRLGDDLIAQHSFGAPAWSPFATRGWTPTEPLPEVVAASVERGFGLPGVAWLFGLALVALVATLYLTDRARARPVIAALVTVLSLSAAGRSLTPRPQLVSFVLVAVVLAAWWATERDLRPRWWLVPLTWAWSLCHGFWFFGVGLGAICVVGLVLDRRATPREALRLALVPVGSLLVVLLNPDGWRVLTGPFAVNDTKRYISEWQHPQLLAPTTLVPLAMVAVTVVAWVVGRRRSAFRLLLAATAVFLVWYADRTVAVAGIMAGPLLAEELERLLGPSLGRAAVVRRRRELGALALASAACLVALALVVPRTSDHPERVPDGLDAALDRLPAGSAVFNLYDLGGWMAWRHPDLHQVIDGLVVPYDNAYVDRYFDALRVRPGWREVVADTGARVALLRTSDPLARAMLTSGWTPTTSGDYVLLTAPASFP